MFSNKNNAALTRFTRQHLDGWRLGKVISASGVMMSGWTDDNRVFLLSPEVYSITDIGATRNGSNYKIEGEFFSSSLSKDNLTISIDNQEKINIFGIWGGDGCHYTEDRWQLERFYQSHYEEVIGIRNNSNKKVAKGYWENFQLIKLHRLEYVKLKMGFSPDQNHFGIFGSGGAEIYTRD